MKKSALLTLIAAATMVSTMPSIAANSTAPSSDNKLKAGAKAVGRGIMWGPKKVGQGLKKMGEGTKKMFSKNK